MWQTIYIIVPKGFAYGCAACTCICPRGTFQRKANAITKGVKCAWCSFSFYQQLVNPTDQKCMHNMATRATRWKTWMYRPSLVILPSVSLLTATWAHRQLAWPTHQHLRMHSLLLLCHHQAFLDFEAGCCRTLNKYRALLRSCNSAYMLRSTIVFDYISTLTRFWWAYYLMTHLNRG